MAEEAGEKPASYRQIRFQAPVGATEIYLVRHAESSALNPEEPFPLANGRGDPGLSAEGEQQAEALGRALAPLAFGAIYVTDLRRTAQTAAPLARATGLVPIVEPDLTEVHMGAWEGGLYREKIAHHDPLVARLFTEGRWDVIAGAESNESLQKRTTRAITKIATEQGDQRIAVFAHAVSISAILAYTTKAPPFAFITADNASISRIVVAGESWSIRSFNEHASAD